MSFVHLHVHSHYSLLDGLPKIPQIVNLAARLKMPAVAITDHGNLYGALEFYHTAQKASVTPIIGIELYLTPGNLYQKRPRLDDTIYHLLLLAENETGYRNLIRLATLANVDGFYYKPRIDRKSLARHSEGLICLSGCLKGELPQAIQKNTIDQAHAIVKEYQTIFGRDRYYIELQRHEPEKSDARSMEREVNQQLIGLARELAIPLVATNDCHYLDPSDADAQDALIGIQTGKTLDDPDRLSLKGFDLSFQSAESMSQRFADVPDAIENTLHIAERCVLKLTTHKLFFPSYPLSENKTADDELRSQAVNGLTLRSMNGALERDRLDYELSVIKGKGFSAYFLVVADFVNWAKQNHIVTTTRGSAAGSLVSYAIGITTLNPLEYKLPFERFLNPERPQAPDIDVDLADDQRDAVINYVVQKYGRRKVAKIVTFGTLLARAAVRDVVRVLNLPYSFGDRIAKMIPLGAQGFPMTVAIALEQNPELRDELDKDTNVKRVLDLAQKIEGSARHASVHAAGVVIAPTDLTDFVPLQREAHGGHDALITQYDMASCEAAGLVKIDFLGIRNLSILEKAIKITSHKKGVILDLESIPLDDEQTYHLLAQGETMGLFQLGGSGMTRYLKELKPSTIHDIMAMVALYRPGPMESIPDYISRKHGKSPVTYLDPRLKDILDQSYGILVYQDDVLMIAIKLAGYSWLEADKLRKAMGKKIPVEMAAQKEKFISGCIKHAKLTHAKSEKLWSLIEPFAAYGFNKAHAASYARVAYQTAYMKAHFPAEFMTAVLTCESDNLETVAIAVKECDKLGIKVLPPDVNTSRADFTCVSDKEIRFGLSAIKNLGSDIAHGIIFERKANGPFLTLSDFLRRLGHKNLNKKSLESLIKSGALDTIGHRHTMLHNLDRMLEFIRQEKHRDNGKQPSLFGTLPEHPRDLTLIPSPTNEEGGSLKWEKELLGLYVTGHPMASFAGKIPSFVTPLDKIAKATKTVYIAGIVTSVEKKITRKGETMIFAKFEDVTGSVEVLVFPTILVQNPELWQPETILYIDGKVTDKDGVPKVLVNTAHPLTDSLIASLSRFEKGSAREREHAPVQGKQPIVTVTLPTRYDPELNTKLKVILTANNGSWPVRVIIPTESSTRHIDTDYSISYNDEVKQAIELITGDGSVSLMH